MPTYTDWMNQFTEAERRTIAAIAKKNYQNLTDDETALLARWNSAQTAFETEIETERQLMQSQSALNRANAIATHSAKASALQTAAQAARQRYDDLIGVNNG